MLKLSIQVSSSEITVDSPLLLPAGKRVWADAFCLLYEIFHHLYKFRGLRSGNPLQANPVRVYPNTFQKFFGHQDPPSDI